jgi:hypothetical protein
MWLTIHYNRQRGRAARTKGLVGVGQGFSVNAAKLQAGSQQIGRLQDRCQLIAGDTADTLAGLAGSAGHAGLAAALTGAAGQGTRTFSATGAAFGHVSSGLAASAATYSKAERANAAAAGSIFGRLT